MKFFILRKNYVMKRYFKLLLIICLLATSIASFAQRNLSQMERKKVPEKQQQSKRDWLINNSEYIIEGVMTDNVGSFIHNNEVYTIQKMQVLHVYRGINISEQIFFVHRNPCFKATPNDDFPYKYAPESHYSIQSKGVFFLKKNMIPINLPDTSKLNKTFENELLLDFFLNPAINFDAQKELNNIFQPMDEDEFGLNKNPIANPSGKKYFGLYGTESFDSGSDMFYFLHQYNNIKIPYEEYFLQEWEEEKKDKLLKEIQDSTIKKRKF